MKKMMLIVAMYALSLPLFANGEQMQIAKFISNLMIVGAHQTSPNQGLNKCLNSVFSSSIFGNWMAAELVSKSTRQEQQDIQNFEDYLSSTLGQEQQLAFEQIATQINKRSKADSERAFNDFLRQVVTSAKPDQISGLLALFNPVKDSSVLFKQKKFMKIMMDNEVCRDSIIEQQF